MRDTLLRQHGGLILNYFRAQKLLSSGVLEGLNNKAKVTMTNPAVSAPSAASNLLYINYWASSPSWNRPRIFLTNHTQTLRSKGWWRGNYSSPRRSKG